MSSEIIELEMVAGEPFGLDFEVTTNDGPENLTGFTAKIDMLDSSGKLVATWNDSSPEITRNNAGGLVSLDIPAATTNGYNFSKARLDLLLINNPKGLRSSVFNIRLNRGVTR